MKMVIIETLQFEYTIFLTNNHKTCKMQQKNYLIILFLFSISFLNAQEIVEHYSDDSDNGGLELGLDATRLLRNIFRFATIFILVG